jgi:hypothetical protein
VICGGETGEGETGVLRGGDSGGDGGSGSFYVRDVRCI